MLGRSHRQGRAGRSAALLLIVVVCFNFAACGGDSSSTTSDSGPFQVTFSLDASFQSVHGGQTVVIAVLQSSDGMIVAQGNGVVSATQDPAFTFVSGDVLEHGIDYEVHYWIDSNFGGGTEGVCDPKAIDHQWSTEFLSVANDIVWTTSHNASLTEDVCGTFI